MTQETAEHASPLTLLAEDEIIFRDSVRELTGGISSAVREMTRTRRSRVPHRPPLRSRIMGAKSPKPTAIGGHGFHAVLAVEELRVDPAVGVLVDVQNTLSQRARALGNDDLKLATCRGWRKTVGDYCALGAASAARPPDYTRARGRRRDVLTDARVDHNANEADLFSCFHGKPELATRIPRSVERGFRGFRWQEEDKLGSAPPHVE